MTKTLNYNIGDSVVVKFNDKVDKSRIWNAECWGIENIDDSNVYLYWWAGMNRINKVVSISEFEQGIKNYDYSDLAISTGRKPQFANTI